MILPPLYPIRFYREIRAGVRCGLPWFTCKKPWRFRSARALFISIHRYRRWGLCAWVRGRIPRCTTYLFPCGYCCTSGWLPDRRRKVLHCHTISLLPDSLWWYLPFQRNLLLRFLHKILRCCPLHPKRSSCSTLPSFSALAALPPMQNSQHTVLTIRLYILYHCSTVDFYVKSRKVMRNLSK